MEISQVKVETYVPKEYVEKIRDELNEIGACKVGNYDHVMSVLHVEGSWKPLKNSNPFNGEKEEINYGTECKMEVRCPFSKVEETVRVIKRIHPYEEPLINILPLLNDLWNVK